MLRTYKSKKDTGGLDPNDVIQNVDERASKFEAFYIKNIKDTKRELSYMGTSQKSYNPIRARRKKYVRRLKEQESLQSPQATCLTPDKSLRVNKAEDLFDQLLKSSPVNNSPIISTYKPALFKEKTKRTYKTRKRDNAKKNKYSSSDNSDSEKENLSYSRNKTVDESDINSHKLVLEKEVITHRQLDDSIEKVKNNLLHLSFGNKTNISNFSDSPLCSTPFRDKYRGKSIFKISPVGPKPRNNDKLSILPNNSVCATPRHTLYVDKTENSIKLDNASSNNDKIGKNAIIAPMKNVLEDSVEENIGDYSKFTKKDTDIGNELTNVKELNKTSFIYDENLDVLEVSKNELIQQSPIPEIYYGDVQDVSIILQTSESIKHRKRSNSNDKSEKLWNKSKELNKTEKNSTIFATSDLPSEQFLGFSNIDSNGDVVEDLEMKHTNEPEQIKSMSPYCNFVKKKERSEKGFKRNQELYEIEKDSAVFSTSDLPSEPFLGFSNADNDDSVHYDVNKYLESDNINDSIHIESRSLYDTCSDSDSIKDSPMCRKEPVVKIKRLDPNIFEKYHKAKYSKDSDSSIENSLCHNRSVLSITDEEAVEKLDPQVSEKYYEEISSKGSNDSVNSSLCHEGSGSKTNSDSGSVESIVKIERLDPRVFEKYYKEKYEKESDCSVNSSSCHERSYSSNTDEESVESGNKDQQEYEKYYKGKYVKDSDQSLNSSSCHEKNDYSNTDDESVELSVKAESLEGQVLEKKYKEKYGKVSTQITKSSNTDEESVKPIVKIERLDPEVFAQYYKEKYGEDIHISPCIEISESSNTDDESVKSVHDMNNSSCQYRSFESSSTDEETDKSIKMEPFSFITIRRKNNMSKDSFIYTFDNSIASDSSFDNDKTIMTNNDADLGQSSRESNEILDDTTVSNVTLRQTRKSKLSKEKTDVIHEVDETVYYGCENDLDSSCLEGNDTLKPTEESIENNMKEMSLVEINEDDAMCKDYETEISATKRFERPTRKVNNSIIVEEPEIEENISSTEDINSEKCSQSTIDKISDNNARQNKEVRRSERIRQSLCRTSQIHKTLIKNRKTILDEPTDFNISEIKNPIVLEPGKRWERSLSIYRRMTTMVDGLDVSVLDIEPKEHKGRKYRQSVITTKELQDLNTSLHNESIISRRNTLSKPVRSSLRLTRGSITSQTISNSSTIFEDLQGFLTEDCDDTVVNLSKLSLDDQVDRVLDKFETSGRGTSARDFVLRRCNQTDVLLFDECYPDTSLKNCRKIGEGVYGEVFLWRSSDGVRVLKVIPVAGDILVNGEKQKEYHEIISEILIAMELSALGTPIPDIERHFDEGNTDSLDLHSLDNATDVFNKVLAVRLVQGSYPNRLLDLWDLYDECKGSENDNPAILPPEQHYLVLELANAGQDLESYQFNNAEQAYALLQQVAFGLAVAEEAFQFEHRDLHWGNVLIAPTDQKYTTFVLRGRAHRVRTSGVKATIIDYSLSRALLSGRVLCADLSNDETLFDALGDYQFEVYRRMRELLGNDWKNYDPHTNVLWLHYTADKMITSLRYTRTNTKIHKHYIAKLKEVKNSVLYHTSACDYVINNVI